MRLPVYYAPAKKSFEISKKSIEISLPWHSSTIPIADRNHDIVRGRLNNYTHNTTEGYLAKPESLVVLYQDKTFLQ